MSGENNETATMMESQIARERALYEAASLDHAIRHFLSRWTPPDSEDRSISRDFEADFIQIVQRIYREAQAPYLKAMAEAMARTPTPHPFVFGKPG
jgi:hypothetical protein